MSEKEFKRLLTSYLDGELTTEEIIQLKNAVEETPSYRHQFQDEVQLHTLLREVVSEKIEEKKISKTSKRKVPKKIKQPKPILAYVFSAVASIAITGIIMGFYFTRTAPQSVGVCVQTPKEGEHRVIRGKQNFVLLKNMELFENDQIISNGSGGTMISLNDGSMVSFEKDTKLTLSENDDTQISLSNGEILLEVSKRKVGNAPFLVKTRDSLLTVLGTTFSVNALKDGFTKLSVYTGQVELHRINDAKKVKVNANQYVQTSSKNLSTIAMKDENTESIQAQIINIQPSDDVTLDGKRIVNDRFLKVRKGERKVFLKFNLKDIGPVKKAVLYLTQEEDPGSGTLFFHLGDRSNWNEKSIRANSAPSPKELIARRTGAVAGRETIEIDLSKAIKGDGLYTVIVTLSKGDAFDIWFSSKEGVNPPILQLTK